MRHIDAQHINVKTTRMPKFCQENNNLATHLLTTIRLVLDERRSNDESDCHFGASFPGSDTSSCFENTSIAQKQRSVVLIGRGGSFFSIIIPIRVLKRRYRRETFAWVCALRTKRHASHLPCSAMSNVNGGYISRAHSQCSLTRLQPLDY
jgi:hypothetical protein